MAPGVNLNMCIVTSRGTFSLQWTPMSQPCKAKRAVTAYFSSKKLLPFGFAGNVLKRGSAGAVFQMFIEMLLIKISGAQCFDCRVFSWDNEIRQRFLVEFMSWMKIVHPLTTWLWYITPQCHLILSGIRPARIVYFFLCVSAPSALSQVWRCAIAKMLIFSKF